MDETKREIRNCPVAVIGGAGFLGSHLVDHLIEDRGCEVLVLDNLITGHRYFVNDKATFLWCDITQSESQLRKIFEKYKIEYVFNYAASPYIPVSFERPLHVFNTNATGALMVLNAAQMAGVVGILQVSSAEIYGDSVAFKLGEDEEMHLGINENYPQSPHSTYGAAKLAIDNLVQTRFKESGLPAIALRQFNCVGARETHPYVIPEIISQISALTIGDNAVVKLGNNTYRDFLYAGDAVRMATELLERGEFGEVYNMGSEQGIKIYDLANLIGKVMGVNVGVSHDVSRDRPWEIWHLKSNNHKIYEVITQRPEVSLVNALKITVDYFRKHGETWDF